MIYIFHTHFEKKLSNATFNCYLKKLTPTLQNKILKYRNWQDGHRSLLGKALLINGLVILGLHQYSLIDIKFSKFQRPYFDEAIDFNISHAGGSVICAISLSNKIGIDVEEIKKIELEDFTNNFSDKEWQEIKKDNSYDGFYKFWTRKEAFLKAIGMGLNIPLKETEVINNKIIWENKEWFIHEIKLGEGYISHLSTNTLLPKIQINEINYY